MQIKIEKLVFEGKGLGRDEVGKPAFIKKSVPGDKLEIQITKDKASFSEGIIEEIIEPSPYRITPKCPHSDRCGGCDHQNISYQDQLKFKEEIFKETLSRAGIKTDILPMAPGSESEFYYRNVIRFFFVQDKDNKISFAMHDYADFNKLVPIDSCLLQSETCNSLLKAIKDLFNYHLEKASLGSLWQLRIREGKFTGDFMVEFITEDNSLPYRSELISLLKTNFPEIKSCYHTTSSHQNLANAKRRLLFGSPIIYEKIGKFTFQISPESFFQTNSLGVKTLYEKIKEFADVKMGDNILDLFCGTGTIGIYLSTLAKKIIGVEIVQNAVNDAQANAKINKITNCEFICDDAAKWLQQYSSSISEKSGTGSSQQASNSRVINKIILDPPRTGLTKGLIHSLYEFSNFINFQLIYVSCNPATFARDIKIFEENGFKLRKTEPLDMFPQTHHIECIGLISK